jgi:hypothetical protein
METIAGVEKKYPGVLDYEMNEKTGELTVV